MRASGKTLISTVLLASALSTFVAGCSDSTPKNTKEAAVSLKVDAPKLTVIDEGQGEKVMLEFKDQPNDEQSVKLEIADGFNQQVLNKDSVTPEAPAGGDVLTFKANALAKSITPTAKDDQPAPARQIDMQINNPDLDDLTLTDDIRSINEFVLGWDAAKDGRVSAVHFAAPKEATDEGRVEVERYLKKFLSLPIMMPSVPVAPGAKWSVDSRVAGDSTMLQTTTYTARSIDGDFVDLDVQVEQRPAVGALSLDGEDTTETAAATGTTAASGQLKVLSSKTTSTGALKLDLKRPLPTDGQVSYTTRVVYGEEERPNRVVQDLTSSLKFVK